MKKNDSKTESLNLWPDNISRCVNGMIDKAKGSSQQSYAIFDADNTLWRYDLTEALLAFLEYKGVLTREHAVQYPSLDLVLGDESLTACYLRLCQFNINIGYAWIACIFSGIRLKTLCRHMNDMLNAGTPVKVFADKERQVELPDIHPPEVFPAQRQMIDKLNSNGIKVYIVTAAPEDLVRMVINRPETGLNIKPENIVGVNLALQNRVNRELVLPAGMRPDTDSPVDWAQYGENDMIPLIIGPATWYEGKVAAIRSRIDMTARPMFVAGDSPSDLPMLSLCNAADGGIRLFVAKGLKDKRLAGAYIRDRVARQRLASEKVGANKNWFFISPESLQAGL